ncbi:Rieske 2Fe-2S domain-containing protein [Prescottella defluvii]|uniref:Rieske 2Fe-2S domain-containing protein n=1 Tax=Prescottella defluvii TaxID=1323361 RepID=UPI0004F3425E|nr:Rieske 2Fe-2S domain-containing protein [Prescottella defluvii]
MTDNSSPEYRVIEGGSNPTRFARGWHCLGLSRDFRDGKPHQVSVFGTQLVVFAAEDGEFGVLDAYCRHMGGNLALGTIKGDTVACPFHDWRWGRNGRCTDIPYARRVPPVARTRAWHTLERNGQLFVWHDPEGREPDADIPTIPETDSPEWTDWTWESILIEGAHCRELIDNNVDMAHFFYVHNSYPTYFKNVFEGDAATQIMENRPRPDRNAGVHFGQSDSKVHSEATYFGPSYMIDRLTSSSSMRTVETILINCHYPVTPDSFVLQYGVMVKRPDGMSAEQADAMAAQFVSGVESGFLEDVKIWKNKTRIDNPLLTEEDGPVYQLRRWYSQFYVDRADVTADMTSRFENEVDTTRARANWEREVTGAAAEWKVAP